MEGNRRRLGRLGKVDWVSLGTHDCRLLHGARKYLNTPLRGLGGFN